MTNLQIKLILNAAQKVLDDSNKPLTLTISHPDGGCYDRHWDELAERIANEDEVVLCFNHPTKGKLFRVYTFGELGGGIRAFKVRDM